VAQRELTPFRVQQAECGCSMLRPRSCQSRL
jgi:hypothetical protein